MKDTDEISEEMTEQVLDDFLRYLTDRRKELEAAITAGMDLDTDDPYLVGHATGMRAGLEMASDLVDSFGMWARRGVRDPLTRGP